MADAPSSERWSEHVRDAVLALVNAQTWVASLTLMRAEQQSLFAPEADDFFAALLERNKDDPAVVRFLTRRRTLLAEAKNSGIDTAYASLITPQYISSLQHEMETLAKGEPRRVDVVRALIALTDEDNHEQRAHLQNELGMSLLNDAGASRRQSLDAAAAAFRDGLALITSDADPELWARLQIGLGDTLAQIAGRADLAGDAIEHYEAAFPHWSCVDPKLGHSIADIIVRLRLARANRTSDGEGGLQDLLRASELMRREDDPERWARLQHNLGETYRLRASATGDPKEMELAIEHFERALEVFSPAAYPVDFGLAANSLGAAYLKRTAGERSDNIERAIKQFDAALAVRPREQYPDYWAKTQINLGGAYMARVAGDRGENIQVAIRHMLASLDGAPTGAWIEAQRGHIELQLAQAYLDRKVGEASASLDQVLKHARAAIELSTADPQGDDLARARRLVGRALAAKHPRTDEEAEEGIANLEQGLAITTAHDGGTNRAQAQEALARLYEFRETSDRAANQQKAIAHYEAAREEYERTGIMPLVGTCDYWIGSVFCKRRDLPERTRLTTAIAKFRSALALLPAEGLETLRVDVNLELGNALADLAAGDRGASLETAIAHYQTALAGLALRDSRLPQVHSALGLALLEWSGGDRSANLEASIEHQRAVLAILTREKDAYQWALAHHNLGNAYAERTLGNRAQNVEDAIENFNAALQVFTREHQPEEWAMSHTSIGGAYLNRTRGDRSENVETAIGHFDDALKVYTREAHPADWAMVTHNLANAYMRRVAGYEPQNIEQAIYGYDQSLAYRTRDALPFFWAMTEVNLGNAYAHREYGDSATNLLTSVRHYRAALDVYTKESAPMEWAWVQLALGSVSSSAVLGVDERIRSLESALVVYTREAHPQRWAVAHNNLALAYRDKSATDPSAAKQAIAHLEQALEVLTPEEYPQECRSARINLADQYFLARDWAVALGFYDDAIAVGETILATAYTEQARLAEASATRRLYTHSAYCLLQLGDAERCVVRLDAGRTRQLAESLARDNADVHRLPADLRERLQKARAELRAVEAETRLRDEDLPRAPVGDITQLKKMFPNVPRQEVSGVTLVSLTLREARIALGGRGLRISFEKRLHEARQVLDEVVREARAIDPEFMHAGIGAAEVISLVPANGALVTFMLTPAGSTALVIPAGAPKIDPTHAVALGANAVDVVDELLNGTSGTSGWLKAYYDSRDDDADMAQWQDVIDSSTRATWDVLMGPVQARIESLGLTNGCPVVLLAQSALSLLPLHAAWHERDGGRRSFVDYHVVTYTPGLYALATGRRRLTEPARGQMRLLSVANPTLDLPYATMEGEAVAKHFMPDKTRQLTGDEATEEAVVGAVGGATYLHFATHGVYDWRDVMRSYLSLAQSARLTLGRIMSTDFDLSAARLAVLSACETGLSEFQRAPDEFLGLPAGFMEGGVPGVVSALWSINDLSTALLFEEFYRRHLGQHEDVATALRGAQLWLRDSTAAQLRLAERWRSVYESTDPPDAYAYRAMRYYMANPTTIPYASPYYWAAFTFNGA